MGMVSGVIADEWAIVQNGVAAVLGTCGITNLARVRTGTEAIALVSIPGADLVVIGSVRDVAPHSAVARIRAVDPDVRSIVLLDGGDRAQALEVIDAGADAVVDRNTSELDLREATVRVARGERYVSPEVLSRSLAPAPPGGDVAGLTPRERAVLELLVQGRSNRDIAAALYVGEATVKTHLSHVYAKLGVSNRVQAVAAVAERGLLR